MAVTALHDPRSGLASVPPSFVRQDMQSVAESAAVVAAYNRGLTNSRVDLNLVNSFDSYPCDPVTGAMRLDRLFPEDSPIHSGIPLQAFKEAFESLGPNPKVFNFQCLAGTIKPGTQWMLELIYAGHIAPDDKTVTTDYDLGNKLADFNPQYSYRCTDGVSRVSNPATKYRLAMPDPWEITAEELIRVLKHCFARPLPPNLPELPERLLLPIEVTPFQKELAEFLDTLPHPFTWRIESSTEAEERQTAFFAERKDKLEMILRAMNVYKERGNEAYRKGDRNRALENYTMASQVNGEDECYMGIFARQERPRKKLMAICFTNRAAAYLMPGRGLDASRAIEDARLAEGEDPWFKKAYLRQARGHTILGNTDKAKEVLNRGLGLKKLAQDPDLLEALALLQLDGLELSS